MTEDWGDSSQGTDKRPLAHLQELHSHRRDERRFQIQVLLVFCGLCLFFLGFELLKGQTAARDLILTALPVFTFVLGKLDRKDG